MWAASATVRPRPAARLTDRVKRLTAPPGAVSVAITLPVCRALVGLVTCAFRVRSDLDRSRALFCTACTSEMASDAAVCSWTGN